MLYVLLECGSTLSKKKPIEFALTDGSTGISSVGSGLWSPVGGALGLEPPDEGLAAGGALEDGAALGLPDALGDGAGVFVLHAQSDNTRIIAISKATVFFILNPP